MVQQFIDLLQQFIQGTITPSAFSDQAVAFWQSEYQHLQTAAPENQIIAQLCLDADALTNEPPYNITAEALREAARRALDQLTELHTEQDKTR
jgi:hypothetical protein